MIKIDLSKIVVNANDVIIPDDTGNPRSYGFHLSNALGFDRADPLKSYALAKKIAEGGGIFEVDEADAAKLRTFAESGAMINFIAGEVILQIDKSIREQEKSDGSSKGSST